MLDALGGGDQPGTTKWPVTAVLAPYAEVIGDKEGAKVLQQTPDEETATDKKLTKLAKATINIAANIV